MARFLSQTLMQTTPSTSLIFKPNCFSTRSRKSQLVEIDLESKTDVEVLGIRKLEDAINNIIVRQSTPDWLPFVPGSSYWVVNPSTDDEAMAVGLSRGWPSAYFVESA
ncbi:hypothetical protein Hanom_Chr06g00490341 [Helianthus anomalus]